jgi:hypothetical protein
LKTWRTVCASCVSIWNTHFGAAVEQRLRLGQVVTVEQLRRVEFLEEGQHLIVGQIGVQALQDVCGLAEQLLRDIGDWLAGGLHR